MVKYEEKRSGMTTILRNKRTVFAGYNVSNR